VISNFPMPGRGHVKSLPKGGLSLFLIQSGTMSPRPKSSSVRPGKSNPARAKQPAASDPLDILRRLDKRVVVPQAEPLRPVVPDARTSEVQRRFETLREVAISLGFAADLKEILDRIVDGLVSVTQCQRGFVMLVAPDGSFSTYTGRLQDRRPWPENDARRISSGVLEHVSASKKPYIASDVQKVDELKSRGSIQEGKILAAVCIPILNPEDRLAGVIYADSSHVIPEFGESDHDVLKFFAVQAAVAIESARRQGELKVRGDRLEEQNLALSRQLAREFALEGMISKSSEMLEVFEVAQRVAPSDMAVLILGESGTGKDVLARAIHSKSGRSHRPFHAVNCVSIPAELVESTLFGHARGSFSGAVSDQPGVFEVANGGTVFLDEIGDMPLEVQPKLLRVLQEKKFERVGEVGKLRTTDVRIVSATNVDIASAVEAGRFRSDLFFRLKGVVLELLPLRERPEDIMPLAEHFLEHAAERKGQSRANLSHDARALLLAHAWPGNVRQLQMVIEGGTLFQDASHTIHADALERFLEVPSRAAGTSRSSDGSLREQIDRVEEQILRQALAQHAGNVTQVSKALDLSRQQLYNKFRKYGIAVRDE